MIPKNLKYGSRVESAIARSSRVNIAPQNGTGVYGLGDLITINIPTRQNLVLVPTESYLKFSFRAVAGTAGQALRFDSCGAHGLIQRIRVFHGSNLLQDIDNYGLLAKVLFDLQQPTDACYGKQTLLAGTRSDTVLTMPTIAAVADISQFSLPSFQTNSGERIGGAQTGLTAAVDTIPAAAASAETYSLNLISLVGSLCSQNYIPLFAMTSAPLRVEIQLIDNLVKSLGTLSGVAGAMSITNCEFIANMIELGDPAMQIIYGSLGSEPLQFVYPDFKNFQFTQTLTQNVTTQVTMPIPAKFSSLKALVVSCRDKGTGAAQFFPFSSVTNGIVDYQFRLGATVVPSKPPSTLSEIYSETLKAFGSIGDISYQPSIDRRSFSVVDSIQYTGDTAIQVSPIQSGSFYIGLDLENYSNADKSTLFSGYNSNTDDIFFMGNFLNVAANKLVRFDAFANFDCVCVCENNTAYVKF